VFYTAPAFSTYDDLFHYYSSSLLIQNSNFVPPSSLVNHTLYTYITAGPFGIAFSESKKIDRVYFIEEIKRALSDAPKYKDNYTFIEKTYEHIKKGSTFETYQTKIDDKIKIPKDSDFPIINKLVYIVHYLLKMNLSWKILY
jgi:hypothetical protein